MLRTTDIVILQQWRVQRLIYSSTGTVVAVGEAYESTSAAHKGCEAVQRAAEGATVVVDGRQGEFDADGSGFFVGPTLLDHVGTDMTVYTDEILDQVFSKFCIGK